MGQGRLEGRVIIITGASRGIGRCMALSFAREGARVVVAAKSVNPRPSLPGTIHTVAEEITRAGGEALPVRVDVRSEDDVRAMVRKTVERFGRIDALINNAGALWWQDVLDTPMKRFDLMHGVNARAAFMCTQAVLPTMIEGGGGHVIVCSPPISLESMGGKTGYLMSKYGMTLLAHGLAEEVKDRGVSVNALWPVTLVESLATINFKIGGPQVWRTPEILADAALEILRSPPAELTGRALLDEDFLRERGVTDFAKYRCDPEHEPPRVMPSQIPKVGLVPG